MKKCEIVKKNWEFNDIIGTGACYKNKYYSIYYKDNEFDISRFGLAVSKKCGNAVARNKIKRQLRFIIDQHRDLFCNHTDYIIMVRKMICEISFLEMEKYFIQLLERKNNEKI